MDKILKKLGMKKGAVSGTSKDETDRPIQSVNYLGKNSDVEVFFPYGFHANVPSGFMAVLFSMLGQSSNKIAMLGSPQERIKVKSGEVVVYHPVTKAKTTYLNDGSVKTETESAILNVQADGSIYQENENGFIKLEANGNVDINGTVIDPTGKITTANGATVDSDVVTDAGISLDNHYHTYVDAGYGGTQPRDTSTSQ